MPYANHDDKKANQKWKYEQGQLSRFRAMGLEPVDLRDVRSDLRCDSCGRVSKRNTAHMFRHEPGCENIEKLERPPRSWSRRPKHATA